jgi:Mitochondrial carrier protein
MSYLGSWRGIPGALTQIFRNEGFFGLYRGHSLTLARAIPHAAIGYTVYEASRRVRIIVPLFDFPTHILLSAGNIVTRAGHTPEKNAYRIYGRYLLGLQAIFF